MSANIVALRYARALFNQAGSDQKKIDSYQSSINLASQLFSIQQANAILRSPVMPANLKKDILFYAIELESYLPEFKNFIEMLIEVNRVDLIPKISESYASLVDDYYGRVRAELITAIAIDDAYTSQIASVLQKDLNKKVLISNTVDPQVLGGFQVKIGHKVLDLSLRSKVEALTTGVSV